LDRKNTLDASDWLKAYVMPNTPLNNNVELKTLLSDVRDIENATGLRFFEGLDRNFVNTQVTSSVANPLNSLITNSVNNPVPSNFANRSAIASTK